jgi:diadenosine tetraphosphate (Ap4A) HIT family hydrolase
MDLAAQSSEGPAFAIHPQLARDTFPVGDLPLSRVLLMNDANFPWAIAVPRRPGAVEIFDLAAADRAQLMTEITSLGALLKELTGCDKINTAAIGNMVPQLHVHVVARSRTDPAWPRPVWGALPPRAYEAAAREHLLAALRERIVES